MTYEKKQSLVHTYVTGTEGKGETRMLHTIVNVVLTTIAGRYATHNLLVSHQAEIPGPLRQPRQIN